MGLIVGFGVHVRPTDETPSISVRSDDLDFNHIHDVLVLLERIDDASILTCGGTPDFRDIRRSAAFERCRDAATNEAVRRMNRPVLTEIAKTRARPQRLAAR
jgi:UrcA family protein